MPHMRRGESKEAVECVGIKRNKKKWTAVVTIYVISHPNHIQFTLSWNNILTEGKIGRAVQDVGKGNQNSFKRK